MKHSRQRALYLASILGVHSLVACEPTLVVGELTCPLAGDAGAVATSPLDPIAVPWSTGFEQGFCDYTRAAGFCFADDPSSYTLVTSPVHSGKFAVAFQVRGVPNNPGQTRCVHQGEFPREAYYSAWYFVPAPAVNSGNWNLFHFLGGQPGSSHGLWDVSLASATNGELSLYVFDFLGLGIRGRGESPPIPIGAWFQIEVYWRRAADATGEFAVYQDGQRILQLADVRTDDTTWGQWYVGNLATDLMPPSSTLYVDDVTVREAQ